MQDSSWMLVLYCDLLVFSVEIELAFACTRSHAHNWLFELSTLIGQFLNSWRDFPKTSCTGYIARSILSSLPYYLLLISSTFESQLDDNSQGSSWELNPWPPAGATITGLFRMYMYMTLYMYTNNTGKLKKHRNINDPVAFCIHNHDKLRIQQ